MRIVTKLPELVHFKKRELFYSIAMMLLLLGMAHSVVATEFDRVATKPLTTHDIWVESQSSIVYSLECQAGDSLKGEFEIVDDGDLFIDDQTKYDLYPGWGQGIDFFIVSEGQYELWMSGNLSNSTFIENNVVKLAWSIDIPSSGSWYVIYLNNCVYRKHIIGSIDRVAQGSIFAYFLGVAGLASILLIGAMLMARKCIESDEPLK